MYNVHTRQLTDDWTSKSFHCTGLSLLYPLQGSRSKWERNTSITIGPVIQNSWNIIILCMIKRDWVCEWVTVFFFTKCAIFQPYHGKIKLYFGPIVIDVFLSHLDLEPCNGYNRDSPVQWNDWLVQSSVSYD
jgi:hypothetical protein